MPEATGVSFAWRPRSSTTRIIFHDSHTPFDIKAHSTASFLRTRGRTMGLLEVGYHYVIERDGTTTECRPHATMGAHCFGANHDSIGVCLAGGCCGVDDFTDDQMVAARALVWALRDTYGQDIKLLGHSEVRKSKYSETCPAFDMGVFRKDYMNQKPEPDTAIVEPLGADGLSTQNRIVLDYLKSGRTLTTLIAIVSLGISSLSSRIAELRKHLKQTGGGSIEGHEAKDHAGRRYLKYEYKPCS